MGMDNTFGQMENSIEESGWIILNTVMEFISGKMGENTRDNLKQITDMVKVLCILKMELNLMGTG